MLRLLYRRSRVWERAGFATANFHTVPGEVRLRSSSKTFFQPYSVECAIDPSHSELAPKVKLLIGGKFLDSRTEEWIDVINPATQDVVSKVPLTTSEEFQEAVQAAKHAYPKWRDTPVTIRQRVMLKLQELIRRDMEKLAQNVTLEQGKTLADARGDVFRGLEVVEHACNMSTLQMGEYVENVSMGIDLYSIRQPLGVCAGICPFNFPAMIPLWMFPVAVTCGNTFVLKPSEKDPGASILLAELAAEAGLPPGVLNIVHGTHDVVNLICDHPDIKAVSFVGSDVGGSAPAPSFLVNDGEHLNPIKEGESFLLRIPSLKSEDSSLSSTSRDSEKENFPQSWVKCPVCEMDIQADNGLINTHLDLCLVEKSSGTNSNQLISQTLGNVQMQIKRKTLSLKNAKRHISSVCALEKAPECEAALMGSHSSALLDKEKHAGQITYFKVEGGGLLETEASLGRKSNFGDGITEIEVSQNGNVASCNCPCHYTRNGDKVYEEVKPLDVCSHKVEAKEGSDLCNKTCNSAELVVSQREDQAREVVIVGRKFNRHTKVEQDMQIKACREPENPKDENAIKIVGPDNQGNLTLGYLPRNLASLLSGLLDKGHLKIEEGCIVKVPEKVFNPFSIKLFCEKLLREDKDDVDGFRKTWNRILEVGALISQSQESFHRHPSEYVQNFAYLLKAVLDRDSHLFDEKELGLLGSFFSLSKSAQCLFVRLSQRKGPWFQVSQIHYAEIPDVDQAANELLVSGFVSAGDSIEDNSCFERSLRERMQVLNVPELKNILSMVNLKKKRAESPKRDDLLGWIVSAAKEKHQDLSAMEGREVANVTLILKQIGFCVRLSDLASLLLWRTQRLFFLNGDQDVSSFLLVDMGAIKYPSYVCNRTRTAFVTREALLAYEQALEVGQAMDMAVENNDLKAIEDCVSRACMELETDSVLSVGVDVCGPDDAFLARFSAAWVFAMVVTLGVSVLEREHRYAEAVKMLKMLLHQSTCPGRRGHWSVRLSIDLEHLGFKEESLAIAEAGLNDSRIRHGDRVALQRRVLRLGKPPRRWKKPPFAKALAQSCKEVTITGRPLNCQTGTKSRFYGYDDDQCSVEELALQYYAGESGGGWQGVHSESSVWMTLFSLLMWDVLFADIPNVFWHPFQVAPLDLTTDAFYPGRKALIEAQLRRIENGEASQLLATTWSKWFGTFCKGLNWERHSLQELQVMASCVSGCALASICRLLAEDYGGLVGGMPDLFLWRLFDMSRSCGLCCRHGPNSLIGEAKLVEVKGPRDRLSEQQRAWISILMGAGMHVEVCKVRELSRQ